MNLHVFTDLLWIPLQANISSCTCIDYKISILIRWQMEGLELARLLQNELEGYTDFLSLIVFYEEQNFLARECCE